SASVSSSLSKALDFCASIGLRVNNSKTVAPCQSISLLGVTFDLVSKATLLHPSFFDRLSQWLDFSARLPFLSKRRMMHFTGSLIFANNAWPGSLSLLSPLFRFLH